MSDEAEADQKTEEPSEKRILEATKQGNTPFSREFVTLGSLIAVLVALAFLVPAAIFRLGTLLSQLIEDPGGWSLIGAHDASVLMSQVGIESAWAMAPIIFILLCGGLASAMVQNPPQLVLKRITPDSSRLSLVKGWKRLFGQQGLVEFLKALFKLGAVGGVGFMVIYSMRWDIWSSMLAHPATLLGIINGIVISALSSIAVAAFVLAIADLAWTRYHWHQQQRMTREEVKNEHKQAEGDPLLKMRMRSIARDRARTRMISRVPEATLVIVNPTHFAVALRYDIEKDPAPIVIAKGQDIIALKIREVSEQNGIDVVEDKTLAKLLYKSVEVDQIVPQEFYRAIAQIIVYLRNKRV